MKSSPAFNPNKWNRDQSIKKSHNCYAYSLNLINNKTSKLCDKYMKKTKKRNCKMFKPQPGRLSGYLDEYKDKKVFTCKRLYRRIRKDNPVIKKLRPNQKVPEGYYKIALAVTSDFDDYHFYRQDNDGLWSHKNGKNRAKFTDKNSRLIKNPEKANRGKYKNFCGYYMVPKNEKIKNMSNKTRRFRNKVSEVERVIKNLKL